MYSGIPLRRTPLGVGTAQSDRGVLISGVVLYINVIIGTPESVLIREVSLFQSVLLRGVQLLDNYTCNNHCPKSGCYMYIHAHCTVWNTMNRVK